MSQLRIGDEVVVTVTGTARGIRWHGLGTFLDLETTESVITGIDLEDPDVQVTVLEPERKPVEDVIREAMGDGTGAKLWSVRLAEVLREGGYLR